MASRNLLCKSCGTKPLVEEDPGSHTAFVWGISKLNKPNDPIIFTMGVETKHIDVPEMICDWCAAPIHQGDVTCAWTFWMDPQVKPEWESEYLDPITDRKQHDW